MTVFHHAENGDIKTVFFDLGCTLINEDRVWQARCREQAAMPEAKKRRVTNGFNTGTRDMKLKTAYRRNKRWSADSQDAGQLHYLLLRNTMFP